MRRYAARNKRIGEPLASPPAGPLRFDAASSGSNWVTTCVGIAGQAVTSPPRPQARSNGSLCRGC